MKLMQLEERAKRAKAVREERDLLHEMFESDNTGITYNTEDIAGIFRIASSRKARDELNKIEKSEDVTFGRAANNQFALTPDEVHWLCGHFKIPPYSALGKRAFVMNNINLKGGVGKSTSGCMIADGLTKSVDHISKQMRILIIDLDPQGSATKHFLGDFRSAALFQSAITLMASESTDLDLINELSIVKDTSNKNVHIIPCTTDDGFLSEQLSEVAEEQGIEVHEMLYERVIKPVEYQYDVIILDAGPHMDNVLRASIGASDGLLTPIPPKEFDFDSTLKFFERFPEIFTSLIERGYDIERLQFSKVFMNLWKENARSSVSRLYNARAMNELTEIFGESDLISEHLPEEEAYQRCADNQHTIFSMAQSTYGKELGDLIPFNRAKAQATKWLNAVWRTISLAHQKFDSNGGK